MTVFIGPFGSGPSPRLPLWESAGGFDRRRNVSDVIGMVLAAERQRVTPEPFPWFLLVLIALGATALVATSAVHLFRYQTADTAREQRWRAEHEALVREATALAKAP